MDSEDDEKSETRADSAPGENKVWTLHPQDLPGVGWKRNAPARKEKAAIATAAAIRVLGITFDIEYTFIAFAIIS